MTLDWKVNVATMISAGAIVAAIAVAYGRIGEKVESQSKAIERLTAQLEDESRERRAMERALSELTVTLRVKGVTP